MYKLDQRKLEWFTIWRDREVTLQGKLLQSFNTPITSKKFELLPRVHLELQLEKEQSSASKTVGLEISLYPRYLRDTEEIIHRNWNQGLKIPKTKVQIAQKSKTKKNKPIKWVGAQLAPIFNLTINWKKKKNIQLIIYKNTYI